MKIVATLLLLSICLSSLINALPPELQERINKIHQDLYKNRPASFNPNDPQFQQEFEDAAEEIAIIILANRAAEIVEAARKKGYNPTS